MVQVSYKNIVVSILIKSGVLLPANEVQDQMASQVHSNNIYRRVNMSLLKLLSNIWEEGMLLSSSYEAIITQTPKPGKDITKNKITGQNH